MIYSIICVAALPKTASVVTAVASEEKREVGEKFKDYFDHSESLARLPNHRLLAMLRGRQENVLGIKVDGEDAPFIEKLLTTLILMRQRQASAVSSSLRLQTAYGKTNGVRILSIAC